MENCVKGKIKIVFDIYLCGQIFPHILSQQLQHLMKKYDVFIIYLCMLCSILVLDRKQRLYIISLCENMSMSTFLIEGFCFGAFFSPKNIFSFIFADPEFPQ